MFRNNGSNDKKKALLARKESILQEIRYYEKQIKEFPRANESVYFGDNSSDSDDGFPTFLDVGPSISELKRQDRLLRTCLQATQELTSVGVLQSEVNVLVQNPTFEGEKPVTEPGTWREVTAECRIDLVPFSITFFTHQPSRRFAAPSSRALRVLPVKASQEAELSASVLAGLTNPSDAVEVLRSYAVAYRSRRTTLARLADKFANSLFMEPLAEGGFVLKCADLLEMSWRLDNKLSSVAPFHHKMNFELEYMDETHLKIIKQAHRQLSDPSLLTDERTQLLANIITTCLQAQAPQLQESMESDPESIRKQDRTILDDEEPTGKDLQGHRTDEEVMAPPKAIPKKARSKGKENKDENRKSVKRSGSLVTDNTGKKARTDTRNKDIDSLGTLQRNNGEANVATNKNNKKITENNQNATNSKSKDGVVDKAKNVDVVKSNKNNKKHADNDQNATETQKGNKIADGDADKAKNIDVAKPNKNNKKHADNDQNVAVNTQKENKSDKEVVKSNKNNKKLADNNQNATESQEEGKSAEVTDKAKNVDVIKSNKNNKKHPDNNQSATETQTGGTNVNVDADKAKNVDVAKLSKKDKVNDNVAVSSKNKAKVTQDNAKGTDGNVPKKTTNKVTSKTAQEKTVTKKTSDHKEVATKETKKNNVVEKNHKHLNDKSTDNDAPKKVANKATSKINEEKSTEKIDPANKEVTTKSKKVNVAEKKNQQNSKDALTKNDQVNKNEIKDKHINTKNYEKTTASSKAKEKTTEQKTQSSENLVKIDNSKNPNAKPNLNKQTMNSKTNQENKDDKKLGNSDANAKKVTNINPANAKKSVNANPKDLVLENSANAKKVTDSDPANAKKSVNANLKEHTENSNKEHITNPLKNVTEKKNLKKINTQNVKNIDNMKLKNNKCKEKSKILIKSHRSSTGKGLKLNISEMLSKIPKKLSPAYAAVLQQNPIRMSPRMVSKLKSSSDSNIQWKPYKLATNIPRLLKKPTAKSK